MMSNISTADDGSPVIALYTPYLQGAYIGELVNQIRQLSYIKGYRLIIIRTGGYGEFNHSLELDNIQGAIIIRNAVAPAMAEALTGRGIACASIAYDYFPLKIPVVSSDSSAGVRLAFEHLYNLGHRKIAFIGELSHYDIRRCYDAYCQLHEDYGLSLREEYLFNVDNSFFAGGMQAASRFAENACEASGIIFGTGQTGIGFIQQQRRVPPATTSASAYVCFDALSMIPVLAPELASVDQNLHLLAYRVFNVIDQQLEGKEVKPNTLVEPKLTRVSSDPKDSYDAFIATCVDLPELHNPNYMKSLISNIHDWPREILASELDQLMSVAPMFEKFMARAALSRYHIDSKGSAWVKIAKAFSPSELSTTARNDSSSLCQASRFPPLSYAREFSGYDTCFHIPIFVQGKIWGLLSLFGDASCPTPASSYFGFAGYIETLIKVYEQQLEIRTLEKRLRNSRASAKEAPTQADASAVIQWDIGNNQTHWSDHALAKLGYKTEVETNIYRHLSITDRIHPEDLDKARKAIAKGKSAKTEFVLHARYRTKNNDYISAIVVGQPQLNPQGAAHGIRFSINIEESEH